MSVSRLASVLGIATAVVAAAIFPRGGYAVCAPPPPNLIAWWPFDQAMSASAVKEIVGGNLGLLVNGAVTTSNGQVYRALALDGLNDHVRAVELNPSNPAPLTIDAWIKPEYPNGIGISPGDRVAIVHYRRQQPGMPPSAEYEFGLIRDASNNARLYFRINCGGTPTLVQTGAPDFPPLQDLGPVATTGTIWTHVTVTFSGSQVRFSQNGASGDAMNFATVAGFGTCTSGLGEWRIGAGHTNPPGVFKGTIDELEIFDVALDLLDLTQMFAVYNALQSGKCDKGQQASVGCARLSSQAEQNFVAWWPLDEQSGTSAADVRGDNDGVHMPGPLSGVLGMVRRAADFASNFVEAFELDGFLGLVVTRPETLTIDAWIRPSPVSWSLFPIVDYIRAGGNAGRYGLSLHGAYHLHFLAEGIVGGTLGGVKHFWCTSNPPIQGDVWNHVAMTVSNGTVNLWVNGRKCSAGTQPIGAYPDASGLWRLGGRHSNGVLAPPPLNWSAQDFFPGPMDEIEIFDTVISDTDIRAIYSAGPKGKCPVPDVGVLLSPLALSALPRALALSAQIDPSGCLKVSAKAIATASATIGKALFNCQKDIAKGKLPSTDCSLEVKVAAKIAAALAKATTTVTERCTVAPEFGFAGAASLQAIDDTRLDFLVDLFGPSGNIPLGAQNCEVKLLQAGGKYFDALLKDYGTCQKKGFKNDAIAEATDLAGCIGEVISKAKAGKLRSKLDDAANSCSPPADTAFDGGTCGLLTGSALADCVAQRARCHACSLLNTTGGLDRLCDNVDNGVDDGSCRGCRDGIVEGGEACDDGNQMDGDGCDTNCTVTACGNGVETPPEECDDGNTTAGDGCSAICEVESFCGDGVVDLGEGCDDGDTSNDDPCPNTCGFAACGDGILCSDPACTTGPSGGPEECDDGNLVGGDECSSSCAVP